MRATLWRIFRQFLFTLRAKPEIDIVYGHNDPMAVGAYLAARDPQRETQKAISYFQKAVDLDPNNAPAWTELGVCKRIARLRHGRHGSS